MTTADQTEPIPDTEEDPMGTATIISTAIIRDGDTRTRQCGRCRRHFPVDASTHADELLDWWACQPCADTLLPQPRRTPSPDVDQPGSRS